jgi:hypothetical protein
MINYEYTQEGMDLKYSILHNINYSSNSIMLLEVSFNSVFDTLNYGLFFLFDLSDSVTTSILLCSK